MKYAWNWLDVERRRILLGRYFKAKQSIQKHENKSWDELPEGFRRHLKKDFFRGFL